MLTPRCLVQWSLETFGSLVLNSFSRFGALERPGIPPHGGGLVYIQLRACAHRRRTDVRLARFRSPHCKRKRPTTRSPSSDDRTARPVPNVATGAPVSPLPSPKQDAVFSRRSRATTVSEGRRSLSLSLPLPLPLSLFFIILKHLHSDTIQ